MLRALALAVVVALAPAPGGAVDASATPAPRLAGTKLLLLRLSFRMDRIDTEYATMSPQERLEQLDGTDALLRQLKTRYLDPHQQSVLFKIEMRVRTLRHELKESR